VSRLKNWFYTVFNALKIPKIFSKDISMIIHFEYDNWNFIWTQLHIEQLQQIAISDALILDVTLIYEIFKTKLHNRWSLNHRNHSNGQFVRCYFLLRNCLIVTIHLRQENKYDTNTLQCRLSTWHSKNSRG